MNVTETINLILEKCEQIIQVQRPNAGNLALISVHGRDENTDRGKKNLPTK